MTLDHQLTCEEAEQLANEVRELIQERTCCLDHALDVTGLVAAGFALDHGGRGEDDNRHAAWLIVKRFNTLARRLERGDFTVIRGMKQ